MLQCPLCDYVVSNVKRSHVIQNMNRHVKLVHEKVVPPIPPWLVHGKTPPLTTPPLQIQDFACPHCDYKSGNKSNVLRHMKDCH